MTFWGIPDDAIVLKIPSKEPVSRKSVRKAGDSFFENQKYLKKKKKLFQYLFFDTQIYSHEYLNLSHVSAFVFFSLLQVSIIEFSKNFKSSTLFNQWEYSVLIQYGVQNILYLLIFFHCDDSCL